MKKLVIFVNGNVIVSALKDQEKINSVWGDIKNGTSEMLSFVSDKTGAEFVLRRSKIDGFYIMEYIEPVKSAHELQQETLVELIKKIVPDDDNRKKGS